MGTPDLTWRRLRVLIQHLPADSALSRSVHGDAVEWGASEHLLANIFDAISALVWQGGNPKKNPKPKPIPRPGDKRAKKRRQLPPDEVRRRLVALRDRDRARKREVTNGS